MAALGLWFSLRNGQGEKYSVKNAMDGKEVSRLAVLLLFLSAFILRIYQIGDIPNGINQDEAMSVVNARAILETGKDLSGNSFPAEFVAWGNSGQSVLLAYSMIPWIAVWGDGLYSIRMVPVLYSMLGLIAFYYVLKQLLSARAAYMITVLAAFTPWHFMQSRWALDCNLMGHLWILGILMLMKALTDRRWYYYGAGIFGLSMYSYGISFYTISLFLVAVIVYLLVKKQISIGQAIGSTAIFLLISWPIDATMLINTFRLPTLSVGGITMPLLQNQVRSQDILIFSFSWEQLWKNVQALFRLLTGQFDYLWFNSNLFFGTIYLCSMPFAIIGLFFMMSRWKREKDEILRSKIFFLAMYILISLWSGIITKEVNVNRMNFLYYGLLLLTGLGLERLKNVRMAVYGIYAVNIAAFMLMYFTTWASGDGFFYDYEQAIKAASRSGKEKCAVVVEYNSPDMAKILTLYEQKIPIKEYHDGKFEEQVSFYQDVDEIKTIHGDTAYVIRLEDEGRFSEVANKDVYGNYAVVYD